jgi:hypothetical protein
VSDAYELPPARFHAQMIIDQRRVIDRLLAGYRPYLDDSLNECWIGMHPDNEVDADMTPAEAAIIRQHQEKWS